jgi:hypothetical protein
MARLISMSTTTMHALVVLDDNDMLQMSNFV